MQNVRQERANAEIMRALSQIIQQKINDPRLSGQFITITYVKCAPDFRYCKVGFSVLGSNRGEVKKVLIKCEGFIKRELMHMVKLPYAPKLDFVLDEGEDNSEKINKILKDLNIPAEEETQED